MDSMKNPIKDSLIIGFAMFAVFFGAGNLIFPPQIGFAAGDQWLPALVGLMLTGMLLPVLGVVAVGLGGGGFERLTRPVAPWFGTVLVFTTMVAIAWLITIPRTASVAFEAGIMTLAPALDPKLGITIFVPLYFAASLIFAIDKNQVIERIGRILTPILLILLVGIVIWAVIDPLAAPANTAATAPFHLGFTTGYQTGDVFTGLLFGVMFIEAIRRRGYTERTGYVRVLGGVALVTFIGLFLVYGGLEYLGATGSGLYTESVSPAELLSRLVSDLAGRTGAIALAVAVLLACLTTAVGATAVMAQYMTKWCKGRISYPVAVVITTVIAAVQSFGGVNYIIAIAGPVFMLFYPVGISVVILGLLPKRLLNDGVWKGTAIMALLVGLYDCITVTSGIFGFGMPSGLGDIYQTIPLASDGFAWVVPAIVGGLVGGLLWKLAGWRNTADPSADVEAAV